MSYNGNGNFQTPTRLPTRTDTSLNAYNAGYNVGQQAYRSDQMDFGTSNSLYSNPNTSKYSKNILYPNIIKKNTKVQILKNLRDYKYNKKIHEYIKKELKKNWEKKQQPILNDMQKQLLNDM